MGLDIALGLMILIGAVRGWFRGFVIQAIHVSGLVGSVYAAAPVRDYARPYVAPYLTSIRADLLDRMLWWTSGALSYMVMVGMASLIVKLYRKRPYGEPEPNRADQMVGFLMGGAKSLIMASFLIWGLETHALGYLRKLPWADEQAKTSNALVWNQQYQPAERIWATHPVQTFVAQVRRMGLNGDSNSHEGGRSPVEVAPAQAATNRTPRLDLPKLTEVGLDPNSPEFLERFDRAVKIIDSVKP